MSITTFTLASTFTMKSGDFILLPFAGKDQPLFTKGDLPTLPVAMQTAEDAGASLTLFRGVIKKLTVQVQTVRLDAEYTTQGEALAQAVHAASGIAKQENAKRLVVLLSEKNSALATAVQEGAILGGYAYDEFLSKKNKPLPVVLAVPGCKPPTRQACTRARQVLDYVNFSRDIVNAPPNKIHPESLAREFSAVGKAAGLKVTVWDEKRIKKEKCGALEAVGRGANSKPRLVIGEYGMTKKGVPHLCLVGKGVTCDTGGYSIKVAGGQVNMKKDMGGAAMMFAAAAAIAKLKLPLRLTVITPLAENDIDSDAYHVGDILRTRAGITVEVGNTDAEGRLILADALALAAERKPDYLIDAATLTGACLVALGEDIAGVFGNDDAFTKQLLQAGKDASELYWELPLHLPYIKMMKSHLADINNTANSRFAGTITAALFLHKFIPAGQKWIHCDIAGPGIKDAPSGHFGTGAKGFGVKSIVTLAQTLGAK